MREKLALVIAALMITSMAFEISTTSVSASPGATVSPTYARAGTRIKLTVTVTNDYTTDNIDNVIIKATSAFLQPIPYSDNLKVAAENMESAVPYLSQAGENLKLAEDNKKSSGPNIKAAGDNLGSVTDGMLAAENASSGSAARTGVLANLTNAMNALQLAADKIDDTSENLDYISAQLSSAGNYLRLASGVGASPKENMENIKDAVGENMDNAGADLVSAASPLLSGDLETAGNYIKDAGDNLSGIGNTLTQAGLKSIFQNAGTQLQTAGNKLIDAGNFLDNAGYALGLAENYLTSAGENLRGSSTSLQTAGNNLKIAASLIENAGIALYDNVLRAGENLKLASDNLENVAAELGVDLGKDNGNAAAVDIDQAAENLRTSGNVDITTAGNELISAASNLSAAISLMKSTATSLGPTTWNLTELTNGVQFDANLDNVITPGNSKNFIFLWTTPNIATQTEYTISVLVSKEETTYTSYASYGDFTLTVDGAVPTLTINVTQVGVAENNVVGNKLDNALATITIVASETLQSISTVIVENSGGSTENLLPPITPTTTDNINYTCTFTVGTWDDNSPRVKVTSAKDLAGNENTAGMVRLFTVDTRAPILADGVQAILSGMRENVRQAGTGTIFRYADNTASKSVIVTARDNVLVGTSTENTRVTSVTISGTAMTRDPAIENRWTKTITLSEGYNSVVEVTATDWTGNSVSDNVENIFIDTVAPSVSFDTVAGKTWDENAELINDSTPTIVLSITDAGLGVALENLRVVLDNNGNIADGLPTWGDNLENASPYVWSVTAGATFENTVVYENGESLSDGTYWIGVVASDNIGHNGVENVVLYRSFTIDTTAPGAPSIDTAYVITSTIDSPLVVKSTSRTISGTAEAGATITVYGTVDTTGTVLGTATVGSDGKWIVTFTLTAGSKTKIEVLATDTAGNEGSRTLYGWMLADDIAPTVTLATLPETTDKTSISISGTVTKDAWEDWSDITLTVQVGTGRVIVPIGAGGSYTYSLKLEEGPNTIVVQATDAIGNASIAASAVVERTVTPWAIYAIILVIVALVLAAIAIFREPIFGRKK